MKKNPRLEERRKKIPQHVRKKVDETATVVTQIEEIHASNIQSMHREAMDLSFFGKRNNDSEQLKRAFELEVGAAMLLVQKNDIEPTRSVLFRSAGWMAMHIDKPELALKLAQEGLKYTVHEDIKIELYELIDDALKELI